MKNNLYFINFSSKMIYIITFFVVFLTWLLYRFKENKSIKKMDWWTPEIQKAENFDFSVVVPKSNKEFWVGKSCYLRETDNEGNKTELFCIIHIKSNIVLTKDGQLLGRFVNNEFIDVEDLPNNIKEWYSACGF